MATGEALFVLLVLLFALGAPLALYALVRAEHDEREEMSREEANRVARRDTDERR
jgi:multisubunit Na+/H+ antiporter MnhG subunit